VCLRGRKSRVPKHSGLCTHGCCCRWGRSPTSACLPANARRPAASARAALAGVHPTLRASSLDAFCGNQPCANHGSCLSASAASSDDGEDPHDADASGDDDVSFAPFGGYGYFGGMSSVTGVGGWTQHARSLSQRRALAL